MCLKFYELWGLFRDCLALFFITNHSQNSMALNNELLFLTAFGLADISFSLSLLVWSWIIYRGFTDMPRASAEMAIMVGIAGTLFTDVLFIF